MTQLLPTGTAVVINQNQVYALPARSCMVTTTAPCDTSIDGTTWTALTSGTIVAATFLRCTTAAPTVVCKPSKT